MAKSYSRYMTVYDSIYYIATVFEKKRATIIHTMNIISQQLMQHLMMVLFGQHLKLLKIETTLFRSF